MKPNWTYFPIHFWVGFMAIFCAIREMEAPLESPTFFLVNYALAGVLGVLASIRFGEYAAVKFKSMLRGYFWLFSASTFAAIVVQLSPKLNISGWQLFGLLIFCFYSLKVDAESRHKEKLSPLMLAAGEGDLAKMETALQQGCILDDMDSQGATALMFAVLNNQEEAVIWLLDRGANPDLVNRKGLSAVTLARKKDFGRIAELIEGSR